MTESTTTSKKTILRLFLLLVALGIVAVWLDKGQGASVSPASSQCPDFSCKYVFPSGCIKSEKEHQGTPTVASVGYDDQRGQVLLSSQAPVPTALMPSVLVSFVVFALWIITLIFAWCHKIYYVAYMIALFGALLFAAVTFSVYLSIELPKKGILWLLVSAYSIPVLLGLLYEHFFNTKSE